MKKIMKRTIIALPLIAALSFGVFAEEYYKNMPTYADGHHTPVHLTKTYRQQTLPTNLQVNIL